MARSDGDGGRDHRRKTARAAYNGRSLRFGYRVHVGVRDTQALVREATDRLLSRLDDAEGAAIRNRSLDNGSVGVRRRAELRQAASGDGFVEDNLWSGIGRARSGCGAAIVGDPEQVLAKLNPYRALGMEAFILSGYLHAAETDLFARHVLPRLEHGPLVEALGQTGSNPAGKGSCTRPCRFPISILNYRHR